MIKRKIVAAVFAVVTMSAQASYWDDKETSGEVTFVGEVPAMCGFQIEDNEGTLIFADQDSGGVDAADLRVFSNTGEATLTFTTKGKHDIAATELSFLNDDGYEIANGGSTKAVHNQMFSVNAKTTKKTTEMVAGEHRVDYTVTIECF